MAALRALATEGIQRGHMTLHARSVALAAGAEGSVVDEIAAELVRRGEVKLGVAEQLLAASRSGERAS
jgi:hydroxymethylglutaryl-CoA reductase